jgi:DNA polymerase III subunit gamma/tau
MAQLALYRKYRSQSFEDLIGQEHVVRTLQSALNTNRVAQSFLFTGPRGTGKTSTARLLAKALNCEKGASGTPCNECESCKMITSGSHPDVIEMDAASESGVDDVREKIIEVVSYAPMMAKTKVFIVDEVHDLSAKAFDALLKTIEEPPSHLVFILATTEFSKVPATIRSRCQKFEFHRATMKNLVDRLTYVCQQETVESEPAAITAIARMADGGFRDALTLLEQAILVSDGNITVNVIYDQLGLVPEESIDQLLFAIQSQQIAEVIEVLESVIRSGRDPRALLESMLYRLADLSRVAFSVKNDEMDAVRESSLHEVATRLGRPFIISIRSQLAEAHKVIRDITLPRLWLESELIRMASSYQTGSQANSTPVVKSTSSQQKPQVTKALVQSVEAKAEVETESGGEEIHLSSTPSYGDVWEQFVSLLPKNPKTGFSSPHALKLASSRLLEDSGEKFTVAIEKEMDFDWFQQDTKRIGFLTTNLNLINREGATIELVLEKKNEPRVTESEAVELPIDGSRLEQMVHKVFGLQKDP